MTILVKSQIKNVPYSQCLIQQSSTSNINMQPSAYLKKGCSSLRGYWCKTIIVGFLFLILSLFYGLIYRGLAYASPPSVIFAYIIDLIIVFFYVTGRINTSVIIAQKKQLKMKDFFQCLKNWKRTRQYLVTQLLYLLYIILWSLLIVMGFVKYFSYRMSIFLISQDPELLPSQALDRSQKMMHGKKIQLFKLQLVFWAIGLPQFIVSIILQEQLLSHDGNPDTILSLSIGLLVLIFIRIIVMDPYYYVCLADFYESIKSKEQESIQVDNNNFDVGNNFQINNKSNIKDNLNASPN